MKRWWFHHRNRTRADLKDRTANRTWWIRPEKSKEAMRILVRSAQGKAFTSDIGNLSTGRPIPISARLKQLEPFNDDHEILRVGGRIEWGPYYLDQKHRTNLLDSKSVKRIISELHVNLAHSAPEPTLAEFRLCSWAIEAIRLVSCVARKCFLTTCKIGSTHTSISWDFNKIDSA